MLRKWFWLCIGISAFASFFASLKGVEQEGCQVSLDFLYWKAKEKWFTLTNESSPLFTTTDFTRERVKRPHFDWDAGFRLGVGYSSPCLCVDPSLEWTFYQTSLKQHKNTDDNDLTNVNHQRGMFPIWALSKDIIAGDYVAEAKLRGNLTLNLIDGKLARTYFCYGCLEIVPYGGLRAAFIDQKARIKYSGGIFLADILEGGINRRGIDHVHMRNNFWGVGPRLGVEPRWHFCQNLYLFADASISALGGSFDIEQKETYIRKKRFSHHKDFGALRWVGDLAAGISFETCLCDRYLAQLQLKWEYHQFWRQVEWKRDRFHLTHANRNLSFQGLTVSGNFTF